MSTRDTYPVSVLSAADPLTEQERVELNERQQKEWLDKTIDTVIAFAEADQAVAKKLCARVADLAGQDDALSALVSGRLRLDREGKKRGRPKKWTHGTYVWLVTFYYGARMHGFSPSEAFEMVAGAMGVKNRERDPLNDASPLDLLVAQLQKKHLPNANKAVALEDLPDFLRDYVAKERTRIQPRSQPPSHRPNVDASP